MRSFRSMLIILMLLIGGSLILLLYNDIYLGSNEEKSRDVFTDSPKLQSTKKDKATADLLNGQLFDFMQGDSNKVLGHYGEPNRKDLSAYGYTWWVYTNHRSYYIQFGIKNDVVETIFATGEDISSGPFQIGMDYDALSEQFSIKDEVTYQTGMSKYTFLLNAEELAMAPLIKLSDDLFIQTYVDTFTNELSSIRVITGDLLKTQRFYGMEYRGDLNDDIDLSAEEWKVVEKGMEKQVLDISNIYRKRHSVSPLTQDASVAEVAYLHSKDMHDNDYFSHDRLDGTGLKERLLEKDIAYRSGGENIAANYSDAPAAVEGWLNSEGHREALLSSDYTNLGVGVYRLYYTQNFISK